MIRVKVTCFVFATYITANIIIERSKTVEDLEQKIKDHYANNVDFNSVYGLGFILKKRTPVGDYLSDEEKTLAECNINDNDVIGLFPLEDGSSVTSDSLIPDINAYLESGDSDDSDYLGEDSDGII